MKTSRNIPCPVCKATGKVRHQITEITTKGKFDRSYTDVCETCKGFKTITPTMKKKLDADAKAAKEFWCNCGNPSGQANYYQVGHYHGWDCADCGKCLQVG